MQLGWKQAMTFQLRSSSVCEIVTEEKGGVRGDNIREEEEDKGCLPPGLHHRRDDEDVGREMLGVETFMGRTEEGIQLNHTRIECIFNQAAVFPDVTVRLCVRPRGVLSARSRNLCQSHAHIHAQTYTQRLLGSAAAIHSGFHMAWTCYNSQEEEKSQQYIERFTILIKSIGFVTVLVCEWNLCGMHTTKMELQSIH